MVIFVDLKDLQQHHWPYGRVDAYLYESTYMHTYMYPNKILVSSEPNPTQQ